ncbi:MAG: hypothetical protein ACO3FE_02475 [Planctomycetaceae bacterium]
MKSSSESVVPAAEEQPIAADRTCRKPGSRFFKADCWEWIAARLYPANTDTTPQI